MIFKIRGDEEMGDIRVRFRVLPYLNLQATNLRNLICWDDATEPVDTCRLTRAELEAFSETPMVVEYACCHTQAIERAVKEVIPEELFFEFERCNGMQVTGACCAVCGQERRDGYIRGRALHCELMPKINSKKDLALLSQLSLD